MKSDIIYFSISFVPLLLSLGCLVSAIVCSRLSPGILSVIGVCSFLGGNCVLELLCYLVLHGISRSENSYKVLLKDQVQHPQVPVVYSKRYNITAFGLEKLHPFDSCKCKNVSDQLIQKYQLVKAHELIEPQILPLQDLYSHHTLSFLLRLHYSVCLVSILEVPVCFLPASIIRWRVLYPMLYQSGGTLAAGTLAMKHGWAINLGGGFHHAYASGGSGFCVYADISMTIHMLRREYAPSLTRFLIVDLDAHQGNGHERDFLDDPVVYVLDAYNPFIFPNDTAAMRGIHTKMLTNGAMQDEVYLSSLKSTLRSTVEDLTPEFILYNAGTDCLLNDPLGGMQLSEAAIIERDFLVFQVALEKRIPIVMVFSGGYQQNNAQVIAKSINNFVTKLKLLPSTP